MGFEGRHVGSKAPALHAKVARPAKSKTTLKVVAVTISAIVFIAVLTIFAGAVALPAVTGSQIYTVLTRSMEPTLPPGTFLVVKPTDPTQLQVGDVITYQIESGKPEVITHRIISKQTTSTGKTQFITKGDNNALEDKKPVQPEQIRGKLWYNIPLLGHYTNIKNTQTFEIIKYATIAVLFAYGIYMMASWGKDRLKKRQETT